MKENVCNLFYRLCQKRKNKSAFGYIKNQQVELVSYKDYYKQVLTLFTVLRDLGLRASDNVAILATTSPLWHMIDLAILSSKATVVPLFPNLDESEALHILDNSESKIIFIDNSIQLEKLYNIRPKNLKTIVLMDEFIVPSEYKFENVEIINLMAKIRGLETTCSESEFKDSVQSIEPDDNATIIYTSGTTGMPKGAVLTHKALMNMITNIQESFGGSISQFDRSLIFLPLSHVLGRLDSYLPLAIGLESIYAASMDHLFENLKIVKPTIMIGVPRVFEKIYEHIQREVSALSPLKKIITNKAQDISKRYFEWINKDLTPPTYLSIQREIAYKIFYKRIYDSLGGNIRFFISGGAPLAPRIIKELRLANLTVLEGYGLTETAAACTINPISRPKPGSVGLPMGDVQIGLSENSEIMIKTDSLLKEYYKNPKSTEKKIINGWYATGDLGRIDKDGYLYITGRIKDIIITSGGKNISPSKIEKLAKGTKYISHILVIGDKKKFLTAIIGIERERFQKNLKELGLSVNSDLKKYTNNQGVKELVEADIESINNSLPRYEQIKSYAFFDTELSVSGGELTPSLKLRKSVLLTHYKDKINALYQHS